MINEDTVHKYVEALKYYDKALMDICKSYEQSVYIANLLHAFTTALLFDITDSEYTPDDVKEDADVKEEDADVKEDAD